ncbi:hypothetical protein ACF08W_21730 [Streptomyces sp. NPDC015144]|uniref:hypothetical protein n=1 Tax=Streptomyces sp. NPDC015144 TaxID=3364944 RepID=UPI0036F60FB0
MQTPAAGQPGHDPLNHPADPAADLHGPASEPGSASRAAKNHTTATVFLDADCKGDVYYSLPPGAGAGDRLQTRSVIFS